jgi:KDO2-lipid IV(A) lauroyltransferase
VAILEWILVVVLGKVFALLPASAAYRLGEGVGRLAYHLDRRHRTITVENLAQAFPGKCAPGEIEALAHAVFENLGRTAVDVARSDRLLRKCKLGAFHIDGRERLQEAGRRGKGVLVITAHFGPWELLPLVPTLCYGQSHMVARPLDNPWLDDLFTAMREREGSRIIRKRAAVQAILQVLRRGETVGVLIDQHISEREGVVVPFFARPASTAYAPALIAMRSGAAVFPVVILREGRGRYRVLIADEVPVRRSRDFKADLVENTARFTAAIEGFIRKYPDHWFWVHRRWKTRQPVDRRFGISDPPRRQETAEVSGKRR